MTKYTNGANGTAERLSGASDAKYDDGTRYHVIRDGVMRMAVRGCELKATDIVESVDDPDSRTQLVADIQAWLEGNVGFSVWLTDVMEQVHGWLDRQAAITERETNGKCNNSGENVTDSREKLEADVCEWVDDIGWLSDKETQVADFIAWLDRQAAITERECTWRWQSIAEDRDRAEVEHGKLQQRVDELEAALAMDSRIRAQQSNCIDNLAKRRDELESQVDKLERVNRYGWECECKLQAERDALADDLAECMEERDSLEHDLSETEAEFAKEMAETLSLHSKQQAASHQAWVDAADERDYWKQEVQYCMDAAYPPSHAPERPYDPRVMAYPDREGCTTPSTLVSAMIDGLRDDVRDTVMPIVEESVKAKAECERWRDACGSMMDAAHEIERIMREFEEK